MNNIKRTLLIFQGSLSATEDDDLDETPPAVCKFYF